MEQPAITIDIDNTAPYFAFARRNSRELSYIRNEAGTSSVNQLQPTNQELN